MSTQATVRSGSPLINKAVFHLVPLPLADPVSVIDLDGRREVILRDVERARAKRELDVHAVHVYEDFEPAGGLSPDRVVRAAQATAEFLLRAGVARVVGDRSVPLVVVDAVRSAGIEVVCDAELGIMERRTKTPREVEALRDAQRVTEDAVRLACETIARAHTRDDGVLVDDAGEVWTSERVRAQIRHVLGELGAAGDKCVVAGGPHGGDCHGEGEGPLRTGEPVIIDIFPKHLATGYHGDCTRTVVHGDVPTEVARMHATVVEAKAASLAATRTGATGKSVHDAATAVITKAGYSLEFPKGDIPMQGPATGFCSMPHGVGHGIGLDLKEPPLVDATGIELIAGDAVTIEPGLYAPGLGGVRIEDLVIVRDGGYENLNRLHEGLDWA
ncbi:MAG: Xaa-Pro peptidase family protein [Planctomycetota bacterium]